jgi:methyltransferase (TIGR00027 family)
MHVQTTTLRPERPEQCTAHSALMARAAGALDPDQAARCPDLLAPAFLRQALGWAPETAADAARVRDYREACVPGIYYFHMARTRYIDRAFTARLAGPDEVDQVVVLGAGYDSRALRFIHLLTGRPVFEVDRPDVQRAKVTAVRRIVGRRAGGVRYVPSDLADPQLPARLSARGFDPTRPTLFLLEGVSYYLDPGALRAAFGVVAAAAAGSSVVFDFLDAGVLTGRGYGYGTAAHVEYVERIGEPFRCGLDPDPKRLGEQMRGFDLQLTDLATPTDLERQELTGPANRLAGRVVSHLYLAQARVKR